MKKRGISAGCLVLALALSISFLTALPAAVSPAVSAVTQAEIDALKGDASALNQQKKELEAQLAAIAADKSKALERKNLLERQINVIQSEINNITEQIAMYDGLIAQKEAELAELERQEAEQYRLFCERIRVMEEEGQVSYWSILFNSSDFSDMLDRFMMVEEIIEYDNSVMDALLATQAQIEQEKAGLEETRAGQAAAKQEQEAARAQLKSQQAEVDQLIGEISAKEDELERMESGLKAAAAAMDAEIRRKEKELEAQLAAAGANIVSEDNFIWPLKSNMTLTSFFGSRTHPVTGKPNNHTGIDVAAPGGTNILAAKSGVVLTSTYNRSYGNYAVISHGNGQTTLYAHMRSAPIVKEGQSVTQGQVIGYVGSTGSSTGNHLHFEVRVNGARKDPLSYFKGSTLYARSDGKTVTYVVP